MAVAGRWLARWWKLSIPAAVVIAFALSRAPSLLELVVSLTTGFTLITALVMLSRGGPPLFATLVLACLPLMLVAGFARGSAKNAQEDYDYYGNGSALNTVHARHLEESLAVVATWTCLLAASTLMRTGDAKEGHSSD